MCPRQSAVDFVNELLENDDFDVDYAPCTSSGSTFKNLPARNNLRLRKFQNTPCQHSGSNPKSLRVSSTHKAGSRKLFESLGHTLLLFFQCQSHITQTVECDEIGSGTDRRQNTTREKESNCLGLQVPRRLGLIAPCEL